MKNKSKELTKFITPGKLGAIFLLSATVAMLASHTVVGGGRNDKDRDDEQTQYRPINLVSDISGVGQIQDTNLVNPWGSAFAATGPFWVGDNGAGVATLYAVTNDPSGNPHVARNGLVVTIPGAGNVTGMFKNNTAGFNGDAFVFVSEDGTISGWRGALGTKAEILTNRSSAVYKGTTLVTNGINILLLAANFSESTIDVYDSSLRLLGQFADRNAPAGYAPFNVQNIAGTIFVTFAKQDAAKHDDVPGRGHGLIDIFDAVRGTFHRFATGRDAGGNIREMNSPWGVTLAPTTFGTHADQLLVGNFGSGTIMSFEADGRFRGLLQSTEECPVTIDDLWSLNFGSTSNAGVPTDLYFTAGPNHEAHGLFGVIQKEKETDDHDRDHRY